STSEDAFAVAMGPVGSAGAGGGAGGVNVEPAAQLQSLPVIVPLSVVPALLATWVWASSLRPQRPTSPEVGPVISLVIDAWIWAWVRATLQMRTSSSAPLKNP